MHLDKQKLRFLEILVKTWESVKTHTQSKPFVFVTFFRKKDKDCNINCCSLLTTKKKNYILCTLKQRRAKLLPSGFCEVLTETSRIKLKKKYVEIKFLCLLICWKCKVSICDKEIQSFVCYRHLAVELCFWFQKTRSVTNFLRSWNIW